MEKLLKKLFDFQKFEKNEKIEKMISDLDGKYEPELLMDDALSFAVGGQKQENKDENK